MPKTAGADDRKSAPDKKVNAADKKTPIELKSHEHKTEQKKPALPNARHPDNRIGIAIVGLGTFTLGQIMPAFGSCKYVKPVALVSSTPEKAAIVARQYGIPQEHIYDYKNFDDIRNNPDIDAVYIVLPNSMHEEFTIRAAQAGKHVLCEKPIATTVDAAQRMIDACKEAKKRLMIAYRIQYEPANRQIMQWVRNEQYGKVKLIESVNAQNMADPEQWRLKRKLSGGGALPDIGLYCLNTIRFLLGEEPEWVNATMYSTPGDKRFKEVEEAVTWQMQFPGGTLANCATSYGVHKSRRYRCYADKGGWFGMDPAFDYHGVKMELSEAKGEQEWRSQPGIGEVNQFAAEMDHFAKCLMDNKQPYTPGEEGLQDQIIMEAIYESARSGQAVKLKKIKKKDAFRGTEPDSE